jgi:hypothetical protein
MSVFDTRNYKSNKHFRAGSSTPPHNYKTEDKRFLTLETLNDLNMLSDPNFKKKLEKLNMKFYLETDKVNIIKQELEKAQDNLFFIMFRQINIYALEIEKLNKKIKDLESRNSSNVNIF